MPLALPSARGAFCVHVANAVPHGRRALVRLYSEPLRLKDSQLWIPVFLGTGTTTVPLPHSRFSILDVLSMIDHDYDPSTDRPSSPTREFSVL
jgi:hypothetical protein